MLPVQENRAMKNTIITERGQHIELTSDVQ